MFDAADLPQKTESHYEYVAQRNYKAEAKLKKKVFNRTQQLEGWCARTKSSFLMDLIFNHKPQVVVEIGVWGGKSLIPMAEALKYNREGVIFGIDPWKSSDSVVGHDGVNAEWWGMVDHTKVMNGFLGWLKEFELQDYVEVLRTTSEKARPIYQIDLIHIDGNHCEESALFDVKKWVPLVRKGGFIIFDDLDWPSTGKAVSWLDDHCQRITTFHEDNVWGVWLKIDSVE